MFYDPSLYPCVQTLERSWRVFRREAERLPERFFMPWLETGVYEGDGWRIFPLFIDGPSIVLEHLCHRNVQLCPETVEIIRRIPGMWLGGFSVLYPATHVKTHRGDARGVVRCHIGLVVPRDCALRVGGEIRPWSEGRCLLFDDTVPHDAWNHASSRRIVLIVDFLEDVARRDEPSYAEHVVTRRIPIATPAEQPSEEEPLAHA